MAADVAADMVLAQLFFDHLDGREDGPLGATGTKRRWARVHLGHRFADRQLVARLHGGHRCWQQLRRVLPDERPDAFQQDSASVFAAHGQHVFAVHPNVQVGLVQDAVDVLLDEVGLAFFHHQQAALARAKAFEFFVDQRVGDVQHIQRNVGLAEVVGQAQQLQRPHHAVVQATLHHDAKVLRTFRKEFVELVLLNELQGRWPARVGFFLLVQIAGGRQHDAVDIALGVFDGVFEGEAGPHVVAGGKPAMHMAGADAQFQHHRCVAGLGQLETFFHGMNDAGQIGAWIDQPDLRLHGKSVRALLHDAGALAVVFTHDQHGTASHATRSQVGQRVRGHIGAHSRFEGDRTAQRVINRGGQCGCGRGL